MNNLREYFESLARGEILEKKQKRYVLKPDLNPEEAFVEERESSIGLDQETLTKETITLHKLGCSHTVGAIGAQELVGFCDKCNCSICFRCGIRCSRCLALICPSCVRLYEVTPYCLKCRNIVLLKNVSVSSLKGLHTLLGKEL